jgi:hypothetical protein
LRASSHWFVDQTNGWLPAEEPPVPAVQIIEDSLDVGMMDKAGHALAAAASAYLAAYVHPERLIDAVKDLFQTIELLLKVVRLTSQPERVAGLQPGNGRSGSSRAPTRHGTFPDDATGDPSSAPSSASSSPIRWLTTRVLSPSISVGDLRSVPHSWGVDRRARPRLQGTACFHLPVSLLPCRVHHPGGGRCHPLPRRGRDRCAAPKTAQRPARESAAWVPVFSGWCRRSIIGYGSARRAGLTFWSTSPSARRASSGGEGSGDNLEPA